MMVVVNGVDDGGDGVVEARVSSQRGGRELG